MARPEYIGWSNLIGLDFTDRLVNNSHTGIIQVISAYLRDISTSKVPGIGRNVLLNFEIIWIGIGQSDNYNSSSKSVGKVYTFTKAPI